MTRTILCPVDFSTASRGAVQYAAALARHFGSGLVILTVTDPLLAEAAAMQSSDARVVDDTRAELERFTASAIERPHPSVRVTYEVATGQPAPEILRVAKARRSELIVISSHGLSGFRKMFFGSTTERVLRETTVPVLIVPGGGPGPSSLEEAAAHVRRVLVPVLFPPSSGQPLAVARAVSDALGVPALLLHVVEPLRALSPRADALVPGIERERRARAEAELARVTAGQGPSAEALIAYGEPSEEIVKVARDRHAGLIVMGLQGSSLSGPRIGSVTYRVLCAAPCPVLALPPDAAGGARGKSRSARKNTEAGSGLEGGDRGKH